MNPTLSTPKTLRYALGLGLSLSGLGALSACNNTSPFILPPTVSAPQTQDTSTKTTPAPTVTTTPVPAPTVTASATPTPSPTSPPNTGRLIPYTTGALVYNGDGVWTGEAANLESILTAHGVTYREVSTAQLNTMSVDDLAQYGTIVWPGGSGSAEVANLTTQIKANLKTAVQDRGVGYVGFCAGAFIGVWPLELISHSVLDYYFLEYQKIYSDMVLTTWPDGSTHDLVWYGGPVTPDGAGTVIAKYPDGNPAISQIWANRGLVILSGPHPAAPDSTRTSLGDSDGSDAGVAWELMNATLEQKALTAF